MDDVRLRVLIADDEEGMRLGIQRALRRFRTVLPDMGVETSFETELAETGEEALERIAAAPPDILLLDYNLPGMSGLDVMAQLESAEQDVLVIMITAYASIETAVAATKKGAYDFLTKPFRPDELQTVLKKATRHIIVQRKARRLIEEKRRVRFEFLSVLAHEMKAPLAAVEGYLFLLRDHTMGDRLEPYEPQVERMLIRLDGMKKLIFDLLDLTRIESGQKERHLTDVDLVEVARRSLETMQPEAGARAITLKLHSSGEVLVRADWSELEIILNNLVSNAVKYNHDNGRVEVTAEASDAHVVVRVQDTGIGMSSEDVGRLFREFVRIRNRKTRNILGSGLGLSIVRKLVDLYGGDISVDSRPDEGTSFLVTLPAGRGREGEMSHVQDEVHPCD